MHGKCIDYNLYNLYNFNFMKNSIVLCISHYTIFMTLLCRDNVEWDPEQKLKAENIVLEQAKTMLSPEQSSK